MATGPGVVAVLLLSSIISGAAQRFMVSREKHHYDMAGYGALFAMACTAFHQVARMPIWRVECHDLHDASIRDIFRCFIA